MQNASLKSLKPYLNATATQSHDWWTQINHTSGFMTNAASALAILIVTLFISRWVSDGAKKLARKFVAYDADRTLPLFLSQVVRWMILTLGFVAVMNRLGIETTSFITVLGAASLSIGLALQGTLANVASGLMILITKPYRIGDSVKIGEVSGRVRRLGLFSTEVDNLENVRVYIPNTKVFSNEISNVTSNDAVKIEVRVDVDYASDLEQVQTLLLAVARAHPERMEAPEPWVAVHDFAASGITVRVVIAVMPSAAVVARSRLIVEIKAALDGAGVEIPYPHQVAVTKG